MSNIEHDRTEPEYAEYLGHAEYAERPLYTLHPVNGVFWAAFLGTPLAAGIVMAINYARVGNKSAARIAALIGMLATVAVFTVIYMIPEKVLDKFPNAVFYVPQLIIVYLVAKNLQDELVSEHAAKGGFVASSWRSVGIGVICLLVVGVAVFGVAYLVEPSFGTVLEFGNDEVYYSGDATEDDARKLAEALREIEYFGASGASVRLESSSGQHTVSFVLVDNAWGDAELVDAFRTIGGTLAENALSAPLTIHLCDEYFTPQETIVIQ